MLITQNSKERITYVFMMFTQSFRVLMGTMLMIFVHQSCGDDEPICDRWHIFENGHLYSVIVNFISFFNFIILYMSETYRQNFLINNFDVVKSLPDDNLKNALQFRPDLRKRLIELNKFHIIIVVSNLLIYIVNMTVSGFVIIYYYHGGLKTLASLASNVLLVSSKLAEDLFIMYECITTDMLGLSTSIMEPVSYNCVEDPAHENYV